MASSYGEDASTSALKSAYAAVSVPARLSLSHRSRIMADILKHFRGLRLYREAPLVLGYIPAREEFDCRPLLELALSDAKDVALPAFDSRKNRLAFRVVRTLDGLVRGVGGMLEPAAATSRALPDDLGLAGSICLVPGLVFDAAGYRVGYGAGYWDNFLRGFGGLSIGLATDMQISSNPLPHGEFDVAVDVLLTESVIWRCRR